MKIVQVVVTAQKYAQQEEKAVIMKPYATQIDRIQNWKFNINLPKKENPLGNSNC